MQIDTGIEYNTVNNPGVADPTGKSPFNNSKHKLMVKTGNASSALQMGHISTSERMSQLESKRSRLLDKQIAIKEEEQTALYSTGNDFASGVTKSNKRLQNRGSLSQGMKSTKDFEILEGVKVVCFCEQRLGSQKVCPHAESEDVEVVSRIITEQARDFLAADKYTSEDLTVLKEGLDKVGFVRSDNYLTKLAVLIARQEKEIIELKQKESQYDRLVLQN